MQNKKVWTTSNMDRFERVRETLLRSPKKFVRRTSLETPIPPTTVWRVVGKRLVMKPYKLQFVQTAMADDKQKCKQFCFDMQEKVEEEIRQNEKDRSVARLYRGILDPITIEYSSI